MQHYFILTGAMGSGKSTLCTELEKLHIPVIHEPARQILAEQRSFGGRGVPEIDPQHFTDLMLSRAIYHYREHAQVTHPILFDRGIADMIGYADLFGLDLQVYQQAAERYPYHATVFVTPDWPEIYTTDDERKMTYLQAKAFGDKLREIYIELGYSLYELPKTSASHRAQFIISFLQKQ
ncbi:putative ATPase [Catalinimonas alkaloidigena]|uniref:AAA family ATPase n=1 Tax=Catalinimonas alkaloidigena TaxID=1075417 RepID=UPI0024050CDA|nr:AAA family ATPase [Catalinimonas alkaloidigena]MDF9798891.1 putative ATPase [Catalinimonas alkaloidigena]